MKRLVAYDSNQLVDSYLITPKFTRQAGVNIKVSVRYVIAPKLMNIPYLAAAREQVIIDLKLGIQEAICRKRLYSDLLTRISSL